MMSSGSVVARQSGNASTPPKYLNRTALPSMTGSAACGPISPSPSTLVPSETMAMQLPLLVCAKTLSGCCAMSRQGAATPGLYQMAKSARSVIGHFGVTSNLPRYTGCRRSASSASLRALASRSSTLGSRPMASSTVLIGLSLSAVASRLGRQLPLPSIGKTNARAASGTVRQGGAVPARWSVAAGQDIHRLDRPDRAAITASLASPGIALAHEDDRPASPPMRDSLRDGIILTQVHGE